MKNSLKISLLLVAIMATLSPVYGMDDKVGMTSRLMHLMPKNPSEALSMAKKVPLFVAENKCSTMTGICSAYLGILLLEKPAKKTWKFAQNHPIRFSISTVLLSAVVATTAYFRPSAYRFVYDLAQRSAPKLFSAMASPWVAWPVCGAAYFYSGHKIKEMKLRDAEMKRRIQQFVQSNPLSDVLKPIEYNIDKETQKILAEEIKKIFDKNTLNQSLLDRTSNIGILISNEKALEIVKTLVLAGADVNYKATSGSSITALEGACRRFDVEMVDFLLQQGANAKNGPLLATAADLQSPIYAPQMLKIVNLLLAAGASPLTKDFMERTPLKCAQEGLQKNEHVKSYMEEIVRLLENAEKAIEDSIQDEIRKNQKDSFSSISDFLSAIPGNYINVVDYHPIIANIIKKKFSRDAMDAELAKLYRQNATPATTENEQKLVSNRRMLCLCLFHAGARLN